MNIPHASDMLQRSKDASLECIIASIKDNADQGKSCLIVNNKFWYNDFTDLFKQQGFTITAQNTVGSILVSWGLRKD